MSTWTTTSSRMQQCLRLLAKAAVPKRQLPRQAAAAVSRNIAIRHHCNNLSLHEASSPPTRSPPSRTLLCTNGKQHSLSSLALQMDNDDDDSDDESYDASIEGSNTKECHDEKPKHCKTCTCKEDHKASQERIEYEKEGAPFDHSSACNLHTLSNEPLPPPLPEPKFTFLRRVLTHPTTVALDSIQGRKRLLRTLQQETAHSYFALQNHSCNQSDPAYCGVTTLLIVLNAFCVDPLRRWKGGWRYYGHEDLIMENCCLDPERVRRVGIDLAQFAQLASCQGLQVQLKRVPSRPSSNDSNIISKKTNNTNLNTHTATLEDFRRDVKEAMYTSYQSQTENTVVHNNELNEPNPNDDHVTSLKSLLVASYSRSVLGQTGDGHFSPLAAYDAETDSVLVLDVARFKYPSAWVNLPDLYEAMKPVDPITGLSRGWFVMKPPPLSTFYQGSNVQNEAKRPVEQTPAMGDGPACPANGVKVEFCPGNGSKDRKN